MNNADNTDEFEERWNDHLDSAKARLQLSASTKERVNRIEDAISELKEVVAEEAEERR